MSLSAGSVSLVRFLVLGPVPDEGLLRSELARDQFRPFQDGLEEERAGWCDWRNPMILPPDVDWSSQDRFTLFGLRIDVRKVPAPILKAHLDLRIRALMAEKDLAFVGKEARLSLVDEVKAELLPKVQPAMRVVDVAWDTKGGMLWTTASSSKAQGALQVLFIKSFGCELQPLTPLPLAARVAPQIATDTLLALDPLDLEVVEM